MHDSAESIIEGFLSPFEEISEVPSESGNLNQTFYV